uniref:Uncharacterized protein n=1 Tax=Siphoviridae sp. ct0WL2 TaxID=2825294 RepID=A0A8S5PB96_9CAUD|nr:MAG TPA: hypothetical protein [Siphoviridae sp. ct0WL2]
MSGILSELRVLPVGCPVHEAAAPRKTADFCIFMLAAAGLLSN